MSAIIAPQTISDTLARMLSEVGLTGYTITWARNENDGVIKFSVDIGKIVVPIEYLVLSEDVFEREILTPFVQMLADS